MVYISVLHFSNPHSYIPHSQQSSLPATASVHKNHYLVSSKSIDNLHSKPLPERPRDYQRHHLKNPAIEKHERKDCYLFGRSLDDLARNGESDRYGIPLIIRKCIEHLSAEENITQTGILRLSVDSKEFDAVIDAINRGEDVQFDNVEIPVAILKRMLKKLPESLIPLEVYDRRKEFIDSDAFVVIVANIFAGLPAKQLHLLGYVFDFLSDIAYDEEHNKMSANAIGICIWSNIIHHEFQASSDDVDVLAQLARADAESKELAHIVEQIITYWEEIVDEIFRIDENDSIVDTDTLSSHSLISSDTTVVGTYEGSEMN